MITRITDYPELLDLPRQLPVQFSINNEAQRALLADGLVCVVVKRALPDSDEDQCFFVPTERGARVIANPEAARFG
jgi:hypothetical protein